MCNVRVLKVNVQFKISFLRLICHLICELSKDSLKVFSGSSSPTACIVNLLCFYVFYTSTTYIYMITTVTV